MNVVLHKITQKYQNTNPAHVDILMTSSYFKTVIDVKYFYE